VASKILILGALLALGVAGAASPPPLPEYQVKAAFLFNFAKFVEWPPEKLPPEGGPLLICISGADPFAGSLERIVSGRTVAGRGLVVRRPASDEDAKSCHILFTGGDGAARLRSAIGGLESAHVLTVGDGRGFLAAGGAILLFVEADSVKFAISRRAAERAGLTVSSQLLDLARLAD